MHLSQHLRRAAAGALGAAVLASPAFAQLMSTADPFQQATARLYTAQTSIVPMIAGVGFIGMLGLIVMAYFGRFQWKWAFSLGGGLVLLGLLNTVIHYFSGT
jgi:TrbC/VIRB2 pilin